MIDRRSLLGAAAVSPLLWGVAFREAFAATPAGVVVMAKQIDDIISLDPGESFEFSGNEVCGNMYERLVLPNVKDPSKIEGDLAEKWETSADGLTTTFHLREDRFFSSGAPVTAEDVVFSLSRAVILNKSPGFILTQFGFAKDNVAERLKAVDPKTVSLTIGVREAPTFLFYCLSAAVGGVVEKKVAMEHDQGGDFGNGWLKTNSAGSGPFQLREWKASDRVVLDPNPHFKDGTSLKRLIILHRPDPSTQFLGLQKGDIDIARNLSPEQIKQLKGDPKYTLITEKKASVAYMAGNQKTAELAHEKVSQAIKWAIDYQTIETNITPNLFVVEQAFLPVGLPGALTDQPFHKDVAKAKALLAEAGYPNGFTVTLDHQNSAPWSDIAQAIQADLAAIGIKANLLPGEFRAVITKTRARQHQLALLRWGSDYMDPNSNAQTFCENADNSDNATEKTVAWRSSWQDKELTERAAANVRQVDAEKRIIEYEELQRLHRERSPFTFVLQETEVAAMRPGVSGLEIGPLSDQSTYGGIKKEGG